MYEAFVALSGHDGTVTGGQCRHLIRALCDEEVGSTSSSTSGADLALELTAMVLPLQTSEQQQQQQQSSAPQSPSKPTHAPNQRRDSPGESACATVDYEAFTQIFDACLRALDGEKRRGRAEELRSSAPLSTQQPFDAVLPSSQD